jgi:hypothetical protein
MSKKLSGNTMETPDWLLKYRKPGHEIKKIKGNYYLYKRSSQWDPVSKKSKKVSGRYCGKLTPEGIVPPKRKRLPRTHIRIRCLEYGASRLLIDATGQIYEGLLAIRNEDEACALYVRSLLALMGFTRKNSEEAYLRSFLSIAYPQADFSLIPDDEESSSLMKDIQEIGLEWFEDFMVNAGFSKDTDTGTFLFQLSSIYCIEIENEWHIVAATTNAASLCTALRWEDMRTDT